MKYWSKPFSQRSSLDLQLRFYTKMLHFYRARTEHVQSTYRARTEHVQSTLVKHSKNEILVMKKKAFLFSPFKNKRIFYFYGVFPTCSVRALYVLCRSAKDRKNCLCSTVDRNWNRSAATNPAPPSSMLVFQAYQHTHGSRATPSQHWRGGAG